MTTSRLVQFLHPGRREHGWDRAITSSTGWKDWNCGDHRRKFLNVEGSWTRDTKQPPTKSGFTFWGEWEPQSEVRRLALNVHPHHPTWLHTPHLRLEQIETLRKQGCIPCAPGGPQNTDPLVFGDRFQYVLCLQFRGKPPKPQKQTQMAQLQEGDIILFGSCVDGHFALDTVFVVGIYSQVRRNGPLPKWESELHRRITMDLFEIPSCGLRLYRSESWSLEKPFSFVPCLPVDGKPRGFPRPIIQPSGILSSAISPNMKQNFKITRLDGPGQARLAWDAVVQQVLAQGCVLGTNVDEPADASGQFNVHDQWKNFAHSSAS